MPFCPNPECPYLKKIGKPAEFIKGITHCPDCRSPLSEKTIISERKTEAVFTDFHKRLLFTFALLILFRALSHIAVPWIDFQVIIDRFASSGDELNDASFSPRLSVFALGLIPYISAYVLVEIISLFLPSLKKCRTEGYQGRIKLKRVALFGTLILTIIQGYGITRGLVGMFGEEVMYNPGLGSQFLFVLTLTAGTFILIWIAEQITQKGIGHGISILIITGYSWELFKDFIRINEYYEDYARKPFEIFLIIALLVAAIITLAVVVEKGYRKIPVKFSNGKEGYLPFKVTTAGIVPANLASTIITLPIFFLSYFINPNLLNEMLTPGNISYYFVFTILIILLYFLLIPFFYNPKKIMAYLNNKNILFIDKTEKITADYINRYLKNIAFFGSIYLCFLIIIPDILIFLFNIPIYLGVGGIKLIITVAVILDLVEEISARRKSKNLVNIAEFHDLPKTGIAKSLLESSGIPYFMKGYYHRALLYFFGPYIEISIWVPKDKSREAIELINSD